MKGNIFSEPYMLSNTVAVFIILITVAKPVFGRMVMSLIFIAAAIVNTVISISNPEVYRVYGDLAALPSYEHFINNIFSRHITIYVLIVAVGQLLIGMGLVWKGWWEKIALGGAIIFLLAIAPLGAGASFPCTVLLALACGLLLTEKKIIPWPMFLMNKVVRKELHH